MGPEQSASSLPTTESARAHARAQSGQHTRYQRTLPAADSPRRPVGVARDAMLWDEVVEAGNYAVRRLARGARLRLSDPLGDTCVQLVVWNAIQREERCSVADTVKVQWQAYLGNGSLILSDMGRVMLSIVDDTSAGHDAFNAASNRSWNDRKYGSGAVHGTAPNARDLLSTGVTKIGLSRRDIPPAFNLFKPVVVRENGDFEWTQSEPTPGAVVEFRCEMDVIVAVAVTPHVLDPRTTYTVSPVEITAWRAAPPGPDDAIRNSTPEALRAFENTDDWILEHGGAQPTVGAVS